MGVRRRPFVLLGILMGALGVGIFLGTAQRGSADTAGFCAPKQLCVEIADQTSASYSSAGEDRYLAYSVRIFNGGTSNLVNLTLSMTWQDIGAVSTSSRYEDGFSDSRCDEAPTGTITCAVPKNLSSNSPGETYLLVFRTATDAATDETTLTATVTAKEQAKKNQGVDAFASTSNATGYEESGEHDVSFAGGGIAVTLATTPPARGQASTLNVPDDAGLVSSVFELEEKDCPGGVPCVGQLVTTVAAGLSPLNLWITYTGTLPAGTNENNIVVYHTRTGDTVPTAISSPCGGELFSGTVDSSQIPCRRVKITRLQGSNEVRVDLDVWDLHNGDWRWG